MLFRHRRQGAGACVRAPEIELDHFFSRLALDVAVVVVTLSVWVLLSHPRHSHPPGPQRAEDCVYFGRAGARCANGPALSSDELEQSCRFLGRAGRFCPPAPQQ